MKTPRTNATRTSRPAAAEQHETESAIQPSRSPHWPTTTTASCTAPGSIPPKTDELQADIDAMLATSREPSAEEWAIHDYKDSALARLRVRLIEQVSRVAKGIAEHG